MAQGNGRRAGVCKRWEGDRGFGFIKPDTGGKDIFCHFTGIQGDGFRKLEPGQRVEFDTVETQKGPQATNVVVVGS